MRIYIAGPLFNEMELERNRKVRDIVAALGHETFLPQEDGALSYKKIQSGEDASIVRKGIFSMDTEEVRQCDMILCLLDGRVPDEGMCFELGMAYALGKKCIGYMTDQRSLDAHGINLILAESMSVIARSEAELIELLVQK